MVTVYLTEKPSAARDLAEVMGINSRGTFHIETKDGSIIVWVRGHLLTLANPEELDERWGGYWKWDALPMVPSSWVYKVIHGSGGHVKAIQAWLNKASLVVIATDAGREGELIGRLMLEYCKYKGAVKRFWVSEMTPEGISAALANLRPGSEYEPLYHAAKARQHADWLYGLNATRAATLAARVRGDYFPMGRVQTPTLSLIVKRQQAIANFKATEFYELTADLITAKGVPFTVRHAPPEASRIEDKKVATALLGRVKASTPGPIRVQREPGEERAPLPYSLLTLQREANKRLGFSADKTLKLAQALYDKKVLSYPRTDCNYLAENQIAQMPAIIAAVTARMPSAAKALVSQGVLYRKSVFDDSKLSDHHALIPTYLVATELTKEEAEIYDMVCLRFLRAMGQNVLFDKTKVQVDIGGVEFKAADTVVRSLGWKAITL